jgi:hypothetical protein
VVELNYCNNSKRKRKNSGQEERKGGKKIRKEGKGKEEREKKDSGSKSIHTGDESSVGGCVGRFFFQVPGYQKLGQPMFFVTGDLKKKSSHAAAYTRAFFAGKDAPPQPLHNPLSYAPNPSILRVIPLLRPNIPTRPSHTLP